MIHTEHQSYPRPESDLATNLDTCSHCRPGMRSPSSNLLHTQTLADLTSRTSTEESQMSMTLPPIREVLPNEFQSSNYQLRVQQSCSSESRGYSPSTDASTVSMRGGWLSPPYSKRRRLSEENYHSVASQDTRQTFATKLDSKSHSGQDFQPSTRPASPRGKDYSISGGSHTVSREGQYLPQPCTHPEVAYQSLRGERVSLPNISPFTDRMDRNSPPWTDYTFDEPVESSSRSFHPTSQGQLYDSKLAYDHPLHAYGYQQPRGQSYPSTNLRGQVPFSGRYPQPHIHEGYHHDIGHDSKQRKRRGNLPKETTDKLRQWFYEHLTHPYPTEDQKQDLMRQTKLQMNQISNWFINARRRQLPGILNNARAESEVRNAHLSGKTNHQSGLPDQKYSPDSNEEHNSYDGCDEIRGEIKPKGEPV